MSRCRRNRNRRQRSAPIVDSPSLEAWRRLVEQQNMNPRKPFAAGDSDLRRLYEDARRKWFGN